MNTVIFGQVNEPLGAGVVRATKQNMQIENRLEDSRALLPTTMGMCDSTTRTMAALQRNLERIASQLGVGVKLIIPTQLGVRHIL